MNYRTRHKHRMAETSYLSHHKLLLQFVSFFILTIGVTGQSAQLHDPQTVTDCSQGSRAQKDSFIITGEADASGVNINNWRYIDFDAISGDTDQKTVCFIDLMSCSNTPTTGCYCVNKGSNVYQVVFNQTATLDYSNAEVKLVWESVDQFKTVESGAVQLPKVYDGNQGSVTLLVNGENKDLKSGSCVFLLSEGKNNVSFCCNNSLSPCSTKITYKGSETAGDRCLHLTVQETALGMYSFNHAVCGSESDDTLECEALSENAVGTTMTKITTTTTKKTTTMKSTLSTTFLSYTQAHAKSSSDDSDDLPGWSIALIVIFVVGLFAGLLVGLYCCWKRSSESSHNQHVSYHNNRRAIHESPDGNVVTFEQEEGYEGPAPQFENRNLAGDKFSNYLNNSLPYVNSLPLQDNTPVTYSGPVF